MSFLPAWVLAAAAVAAVAAAPRPNLLFMMADQMRWDALGTVTPGAITPWLDRLASEGVRFENAYTSTPSCTPARAAILTGQKPWNHGMLGYGEIAARYPFEMPRALAAVGYTTTAFGKDHFGWNVTLNEGVSHGFQKTSLYDGETTENDDYHQWFIARMGGKEPETGWPTLDMNSWRGAPYIYDEQLHPTAWTGQSAVDFIGNYSNTEPFFLKVSFHRPHSPYDPPQRLLDLISPSDVPPVVTSVDGWDLPYRGGAGDKLACGPSDPDAWCGEMPANETLLAKRAYYASIAFVDEWVGQIYNKLSTMGLLEKTVIVWTSDHGDGQGDHYHWRKTYPYELSAHVPMIMRWPETLRSTHALRVPRGTVLPQVTEMRDIFPTFLDAAGASSSIPSNYSMDGKSLLCLLADPTGATCGWRKWLDLEHDICYDNSNHWNALTDGAIKYIFQAMDASEQLFNLTADPGETRNVAGDPAYNVTLHLWRARMVQQFEDEGRGPTWVKNGVLVVRPNSQLYSPHYPGDPVPPAPPAVQTCTGVGLAPGQAIVLKPHQEDNPIYCQDFMNTTMAGNAPHLALIALPSLCLAAVAAPPATSGLMVDTCTAASPLQAFQAVHAAGHPSNVATVTHAPSGWCVTVTNPGASVNLQPCNASANVNQLWIFGLSGRFCQYAGADVCLSVDIP